MCQNRSALSVADDPFSVPRNDDDPPRFFAIGWQSLFERSDQRCQSGRTIIWAGSDR